MMKLLVASAALSVAVALPQTPAFAAKGPKSVPAEKCEIDISGR